MIRTLHSILIFTFTLILFFGTKTDYLFAAETSELRTPTYSNSQLNTEQDSIFNRTDIDRVVEASKKVALEGNIEAQKFLFEIYRNGLRSFPKDLTEALKWVRMSAEMGDADAQADLGTMLAIGAGTNRDQEGARHWFLRAAKKNNPIAQSNLGVIYQYGKGTPVNLEEAAKWFRLAAEAGNIIAKEQLEEVQRALFVNLSRASRDCFQNRRCRMNGPITLVEADGNWFIIVNPETNTLSLIVPKEIETPHFFRVIEGGSVPKIYFASDQEVTLEAVGKYTQVLDADVSLSASSKHYRLDVASNSLTKGFLKSLEEGGRPILSLLSDDYWAAAEFFHLSKSIIDYEKRTPDRILRSHPDFFCQVISRTYNPLSPDEPKILSCGEPDPKYQETALKLKPNPEISKPFPRIPGKWAVEEIGDKVYVSVNGEMIDGDRLRIEFDKSCELAHTFTSFHTTKNTPGMLEIKDQIAAGIFDKNKINLKILFVIEVRQFRSAIVSLGWNDVAYLKNYFEGREKVSLKMLDDERFKSSDYLDLVENQWSLSGLGRAIDYGQELCRQRDA